MNFKVLLSVIAVAITMGKSNECVSAPLHDGGPKTEIKYFLPENAENAVLYVFSLNGNMLLSKPLTKTGNGSITISGSELEAGMYIYTLAIGGVEVDSKRMILNNQ